MQRRELKNVQVRHFCFTHAARVVCVKLGLCMITRTRLMFMIVLIKQQAGARASQPIINFETFFVLPTDRRPSYRPTERTTDRQRQQLKRLQRRQR